MNADIEELKKLTNIFLDKDSNYGELKCAADDLYALFLRIGEMQDGSQNRESYHLPKGKAIGAYWAGICVTEFMRTRTFLNGIYRAISDAKKIFTDSSIHILYAGCGPFGTLLIPLTTVFHSDEIQITFIDINQYSLECLRKVISALDVKDYVAGIIQGDVTAYVEERDIPIHIVVTETMQNALQKEPQVAITCQLAPLLVEGGIFIPENIIVSAVLMNRAKEKEHLLGKVCISDAIYYPLGTIFELNKDFLKEIDYGQNGFPETVVNLPEKIDVGYKSFELLTEIRVYKEEMLTYNQCSLTLPLRLADFNWLSNKIKQIRLQYIISGKPGLEYQFINKENNPGNITLEQILPAQ